MLIRPDIAESANKDNVVVGESKKSKDVSKVLERQVVLDVTTRLITNRSLCA